MSSKKKILLLSIVWIGCTLIVDYIVAYVLMAFLHTLWLEIPFDYIEQFYQASDENFIEKRV